MGLRYDPQCLRRVAAKIVYGFSHVVARGQLGDKRDEEMRKYILGIVSWPDEPVSIAAHPDTFTTTEAPHSVVISPPRDPTAVLVNLYCFHFRVELGPDGALPQALAVICEIDGSGMRVVSNEETPALIQTVASLQFSQPWKEPLDLLDT